MKDHAEVARLTDEAGMHCLEAHAAARARDTKQASFHLSRAHDLLRDARALLRTEPKGYFSQIWGARP